jgi:hypothetical protein
VRAKILISFGLLIFVLIFAGAAQAQTSFEGFTWKANSRFALQIVHNGVPVAIQGDLRDGDKGTYAAKEDPTVTAELKSYTTELFLVVAITTENDENGSIFLLERPNADWTAMNRQPIRARKLDLIKDVEGIVEAFKTVSNFGIAQSMRKMVEYFEVNPNRRLDDLYDALERNDDFVRTLPRPRVNPESGNVGVVQPRIPDKPYVEESEEELQRPSRQERRREDPEEYPEFEEYEEYEKPAYERPQVFTPTQDPVWAREERERQRQELRRQQYERRLRERQPRFIDPFEPRQPQYSPPQYWQPEPQPRRQRQYQYAPQPEPRRRRFMGGAENRF